MTEVIYVSFKKFKFKKEFGLYIGVSGFITQLTFTCSKSIIESLEKSDKYVQS